MTATQLTVNKDSSSGKINTTLFGLFLEDINFSCDGGLNANMVRNYSFDDLYLKKEKLSEFDFVLGKIKPSQRLKTEPGPLKYWICEGGTLSSESENALSEESGYGRITTDNRALLTNLGYNGHHPNHCAMSVKKDSDYCLKLFIKGSFEGTVSAYITNNNNKKITDTVIIPVSPSWSSENYILKGTDTAYGKLTFELCGSGTVDLDEVMFYCSDYWGKDNPKWSQGLFRKDMVEALKELQPGFLRFPGGCIVEGLDIGNEYHWKDSVGPLLNRKSNYNLWGFREEDFGYSQSYQIGFYEYFLLCEDLNMEPLPVVWAGMNCQMRKRDSIPAEGKVFERDVIQNALDLIEYANGDPEINQWAKLRADAGHPAPFNMKYIGIGNENFGEDYLNRFRTVKNAIDEIYPGITCVLSSGANPDGKDFDFSWNETKKDLPDVYVDEHFYKKPSWVIGQSLRYNHYPKNGAKVFLGEWAAYDAVSGTLKKTYKNNTYDSALAEAAFMTGLENNADVVAMTCYAPLFAMIDGSQWQHNLIWFNPSSVLRTPNYYVQKLYSATVGEFMTPIEGRLPKDLYASATSSEGYLCIKLINTGKTDQPVNLNIIGLNIKEVSFTTMKCDNMKEQHKMTFTGAPVETVTPVTEIISADDLKSLCIQKKSINVICIR